MNVEYDDRGRGTKAYTKRVGAERRIQIHCVAFTQDRLMMSKALEEARPVIDGLQISWGYR